jgi:hypothetical protein
MSVFQRKICERTNTYHFNMGLFVMWPHKVLFDDLYIILISIK